MTTFHMANCHGSALSKPYLDHIRDDMRREQHEREEAVRSEREARYESRLDLFDTNGNGVLSRAELRDALTMITREVTGDSSATINEYAFAAVWGRRLRWETLDAKALLAASRKYRTLLLQELGASHVDADESFGGDYSPSTPTPGSERGRMPGVLPMRPRPNAAPKRERKVAERGTTQARDAMQATVDATITSTACSIL